MVMKAILVWKAGIGWENWELSKTYVAGSNRLRIIRMLEKVFLIFLILYYSHIASRIIPINIDSRQLPVAELENNSFETFCCFTLWMKRFKYHSFQLDFVL